MKILLLRLIAFGPFMDEALDLAQGKEGLHLIYGPNEAGKSSALRALRQFLYGIPERSLDDFRHSYNKMRIGGVLRHSDGTELGMVRRKGRVKTLRSEDDKRAIDDEVLRKFLGGVDASVFATMFGIGHSDLVRGGEEIIRGGGNVGQALFAAGSGIAGLREVQTDLQKEAEALFAPSASRRPINELIGEYRGTQKEMREAELPGQEWEKHERALKTAMDRKAEVDLRLEEKERERNWLERIRQALPLISQRKELKGALRTYENAIILPRDFKDRRIALLTDLKIAENTTHEALSTVEGLEKAAASLQAPEEVVESEALIEESYRMLGVYLAAAKDRIKLVTLRDTLRSEARGILAGLRKDLTLDQAEDLRLEKSETVRIRELGAQYERLITRLDDARASLVRLSHHQAAMEDELKDLDEPKATEELKAFLEQALPFGATEETLELEEEEITRTLRSLEIELMKNSLWKGKVEELETRPLPTTETTEIFEVRFADSRNTVAALMLSLEDVENRLLQIESQIEALDLAQKVPTEDSLREARRRRDETWMLLRKGWEEGGIEKDQTHGLLETYEDRLRHADEIADRLRREADRVAGMARLQSDREREKTRSERLGEGVRRAQEELQKAEKQWLEVWEASGIIPWSPREMRAWLQNQKTLLERRSAILEKKARLDGMKTRIEEHRSRLARSLLCLGDEPREGMGSLTGLIKRAQEVMARQEEIRLKRERCLEEKREREKELRETKVQVVNLETELTRWQGQWERAVGGLGLGKEALPAQANALLEDLRTLFEKLKEADILQKRISGIDRDAEAFTEKVHRLAERIAGDLKDLPPDQVAPELMVRLNRARAAKTRRQSLEVQLRDEKQRLQGARERTGEIHSHLAVMCEQAGCLNHEELPRAEENSEHRQRIESEWEGLEGNLRKLSAGATVEAFVEEAGRVDPDGIDGRVMRIGEEMEAFVEERSRLDQAIGSERGELARMDGTSRAAELAEESQRILGRLETEVEKYARLRVASAVLARAVERYREKHQGPILRRTNELFAHLTLGSFEGIRAEFNQEGTPILVGVRKQGKELVGVEGMSDGTTDQLHLALRLASLETYLENNEPMPFIVDDILIKFDNERAKAALQVLGELSKKTQVVFFTHHRHLVELVELSVDPSVLFIHSLGVPA
jgi:uncharacterized protein YhaN